MHALIAAITLSLAPVHGVVLATTPGGDAIVRIDAAPAVAPETTRRVDQLAARGGPLHGVI